MLEIINTLISNVFVKVGMLATTDLMGGAMVQREANEWSGVK
jgi:hypothetical protein